MELPDFLVPIVVFLSSGIGASLIAEGISYLNKKLMGTPLDGAGAWLVSGAAAFLMTVIQTAITGLPDIHTLQELLNLSGTIWLAAQGFFHLILRHVNALHVTRDSDIPLL